MLGTLLRWLLYAKGGRAAAAARAAGPGQSLFVAFIGIWGACLVGDEASYDCADDAGAAEGVAEGGIGGRRVAGPQVAAEGVGGGAGGIGARSATVEKQHSSCARRVERVAPRPRGEAAGGRVGVGVGWGVACCNTLRTPGLRWKIGTLWHRRRRCLPTHTKVARAVCQ